jgi:hypothetical protein
MWYIKHHNLNLVTDSEQSTAVSNKKKKLDHATYLSLA